MRRRIVLIGASGIFGTLMARRLAGDARFVLVLAGRRHAALEALRASLGDDALQVATLDVTSIHFAKALAALQPQLVIHAAGPFQNRDYRVAEACLACGSDYIDLADGRDFVVGISRLDQRARQAGRLVVSGASTVPALSSAVVDALRPQFDQLCGIELAISPGNRTPRGEATVASILGYCGRPIRVWRDGGWQLSHGWMDGRRQVFPFGRRRVGVCEVPDLDLLPARYAGVHTVIFRAGLELPLLHAGAWCAAALVRLGLVRDLARHAAMLQRLSERFMRFGSDVGGMAVELTGTDHAGAPLRLRWGLDAQAGDGPQVPVTPAVVLARRWAGGGLTATGALPCLGLLTLAELVSGFSDYAIRCDVERLC